MASFTEAAITDGSHTDTVEDFFTSTQTRPLSNPQETMSPHEHIGPKADKGVSTVELGTTPKSRTALPSSVIINQTTADENVDGNTSAAGNILISPSPSPSCHHWSRQQDPLCEPHARSPTNHNHWRSYTYYQIHQPISLPFRR